MFHASFRYNTAGQGLFYTGMFQLLDPNNKKPQSTYNWVYDCGTVSKRRYLHDEILAFSHSVLPLKEKLDLLIISHFDDDHINAIDTLLSSFNGCRHVILPYLTPGERAVLYYWQKVNQDDDKENDGDTSGGGDSIDNIPGTGYLDLIIKPVEFLKNKGVEKITFIRNDEGYGIDFRPENSPLKPEGTIVEEPHFEDAVPDKDENAEVAEDIENLKQVQGVRVVNNKGFLLVGLWEFYFYNQKMHPDTYYDSFRADVDALMKRLGIITLEDLLLKHEKQLKEAYLHRFPRGTPINMTSLIVYHAPIQRLKLVAQKVLHRNALHSDWWDHYHFIHYHFLHDNVFPFYDNFVDDKHKSFSSLLTGDMRTESLTLPQYIIDNYDNIRFLQIPHHGAQNGWDIDNLAHYPPAHPYPVHAIVNYGLGNRDKHPNTKVVDDVIKEGWHLIENNQVSSFAYSAYLNL